MTVRELIMSLLLNGNPDDEVIVETERDNYGVTLFDQSSPRHVVRIGQEDQTLIECHDH